MNEMNGWKRIESQKNRYYKRRGNNLFDFIDIFSSSGNTRNDSFYVSCTTVDISHADETDYDEAMGYLDSTDGQDEEGMKFLDSCLASSWFEKKRYDSEKKSVIVSKDIADFIVKKYIETDGKRFLCNDEEITYARMSSEDRSKNSRKIKHLLGILVPYFDWQIQWRKDNVILSNKAHKSKQITLEYAFKEEFSIIDLTRLNEQVEEMVQQYKNRSDDEGLDLNYMYDNLILVMNLIEAKLNSELDEGGIADLLRFGCYCDSDDFYDDIASMIMNRFEVPRNIAIAIVRRERNLFNCFTDEEFVDACVSTADFVRNCIDLYLDKKD